MKTDHFWVEKSSSTPMGLQCIMHYEQLWPDTI